MKTKVLLMSLALAAITTTGFAQYANQNVKTTQKTGTLTESTTNQVQRACFIDADKNGLCDNFENGTCKIGTGKGLMDGTGNRQGLRDGSGAGRQNRTNNANGVGQGKRGNNRGRAPMNSNRGSRRGRNN